MPYVIDNDFKHECIKRLEKYYYRTLDEASKTIIEEDVVRCAYILVTCNEVADELYRSDMDPKAILRDMWLYWDKAMGESGNVHTWYHGQLKMSAIDTVATEVFGIVTLFEKEVDL